MIHSRQGVRYSIGALTVGDCFDLDSCGNLSMWRHSFSSPLVRTTFKSSKMSVPSKLVATLASRVPFGSSGFSHI